MLYYLSLMTLVYTQYLFYRRTARRRADDIAVVVTDDAARSILLSPAINMLSVSGGIAYTFSENLHHAMASFSTAFKVRLNGN